MSKANMAETMTAARPSLLDFANKEAFGCDDYESRGENADDHTVTREDGLMVILEKSKRLTDRILDGKSVAVALGDMKIMRRDEQEQKGFTLKERHNWQLWKNGKGDLPFMQWQADQEEQHGVDAESNQQDLGKRKANSQEGQTNQRRIKKKKRKNGDEASKVTAVDMEALGAIYRLSPEMRERVVEADVRFFRRTYEPLKPLLSAMVKTLQARSEHIHAASDKKMEEENRSTEKHSTQKAIFAVEKQAKFIMDETVYMCDLIEEQVSIMRGRLSALEEQKEESDEEDMDAISSAATTPVSTQWEDVQDQVEQDVTLVEKVIEPTSSHEKEVARPAALSSPKQSALKQAAQDQSDPFTHDQNAHFSDRSMEYEQDVEAQHNEEYEQLMKYQPNIEFNAAEAAAHSAYEAGQHTNEEQEQFFEGATEPVDGAALGQRIESLQSSKRTVIEDAHDEDDPYDMFQQVTPYDEQMTSYKHVVTTNKQPATHRSVVESHMETEEQVSSPQLQEEHFQQIESAADSRFPILSQADMQQRSSPEVESTPIKSWNRYTLSQPWAQRQEASRGTTTTTTKEAVGRNAHLMPPPPVPTSQPSRSQDRPALFPSSASKSFFDSFHTFKYD